MTPNANSGKHDPNDTICAKCEQRYGAHAWQTEACPGSTTFFPTDPPMYDHWCTWGPDVNPSQPVPPGCEPAAPVEPPHPPATAPGAPDPSCIGNDPTCPCQDGDACHYKDYPGSPAWPIPPDPWYEDETEWLDQLSPPWWGHLWRAWQTIEQWIAENLLTSREWQ